MSIRPRKFQQATIDSAMRTLTGKGARRFLVADEVGLGKTVVASGVIQRLVQSNRQKPLSVLYVCSNLAIARQNMTRLLSFLHPDERKQAIGMIDRPSLLPTKNRPAHPQVHVFQLTPDTAIPTRKGQRRDGRVEERALALVLIRLIAPSVSVQKLYRAFKRNAGSASFKGWVRHFGILARDYAGLGGVEFRGRFREVLREIFGLIEGQHLPPRLCELLDNKEYQNLVAAARTALAVAALRDIDPELVIFDEFQRFRDLTEEDVDASGNVEGDELQQLRERAASRVLHAIRGAAGRSGPALLLLSATPYTPYRSRLERHAEKTIDGGHSSDFFDLVAFLAHDLTIADSARASFLGLREELTKGTLHSERALQLRGYLTAILAPLMSRTERTSVHSLPENRHSGTRIYEEPLLPSDLEQFRAMHDCFGEADQDWIVPLWQSVPLPMQTLGSRYLAWSRKRTMPDSVTLPKKDRDHYRSPAKWPHPRLRALLASVAPPAFAMPWSRPSLPWWPVQGGWKAEDNDNSPDGKLLIFSRFRAVPTAISGLLGFVVESGLPAKIRGDSVSYESLRKHWLKPSSALLELFHPSPFLARVEPLAAPLGDLRTIRAEVRRQLREHLLEIGIRVVRRNTQVHRKPWEVLAAIEGAQNLWGSAWDGVDAGENEDAVGSLAKAVNGWNEAAARGCEVVSSAELDELASLALESPGVVFLRVLLRHWPNAADSKNLPKVVAALWKGLRKYLNAPWFVAAMTSRAVPKYPAAIRRAVIDGGFESVLDEHFWYLAQEGADDLGGVLEDVAGALQLREVNATFHDAATSESDEANDERSFRLRCHLAVPLAEARVQARGVRTGYESRQETEEPLRPDEVRRAFNSPFWPRVLVTTSIGQEGLDLHPWCSALAHWDLATGPVALEQREGRITRFAGLAVRRVIARRLRDQLIPTGKGSSPWKRLADLADQQLGDDSGLSPWWVINGAACTNYVFSTLGSEQREYFEALNQERALYRLVLGMPNQEDLMSALKTRFADGESMDVRGACLDLCAYNLRKESSGTGVGGP